MRPKTRLYSNHLDAAHHRVVLIERDPCLGCRALCTRGGRSKVVQTHEAVPGDSSLVWRHVNGRTRPSGP